MEKFFVSCELGFEQDLRREVQSVSMWFLDLDGRASSFQPREGRLVPGGWEFQAPLHWGLQINFWSRLASRVLLRKGHFVARNFKQLQSEWKKMRIPFSRVQLRVQAEKSKLYHETAIQSELGHTPEAQQRVYLRVHRDEITVSWDATGEHLHRRGREKLVGEAPLRETRAAWGIHKMLEGHMGEAPHWVDPCAGSGTLPLEILNWNQPHPRTFSFQAWPECPHFLRNAPSNWQRQHDLRSNCWSGITAIEKDGRTFEILKKNLTNTSIVAHEGDFQKIRSLGGGEVWCLVNPPYGQRLEEGFPVNELFRACQKWGVAKLGVFFPRKITGADGYELSSEQSFSNGGLQTHLLIFERARNHVQQE